MPINFLFLLIYALTSLLFSGCLPTLHIDGKFTVDHRVIHSVDQYSAEQQDVSVRNLKAMGLVGERFDGYLGIVVPEVDNQIRLTIDQLNNERQEQYMKIVSQSEGSTVGDIELRAGSAFIQREKAGFYILIEGKDWEKK